MAGESPTGRDGPASSTAAAWCRSWPAMTLGVAKGKVRGAGCTVGTVTKVKARRSTAGRWSGRTGRRAACSGPAPRSRSSWGASNRTAVVPGPISGPRDDRAAAPLRSGRLGPAGTPCRSKLPGACSGMRRRRSRRPRSAAPPARARWRRCSADRGRGAGSSSSGRRPRRVLRAPCRSPGGPSRRRARVRPAGLHREREKNWSPFAVPYSVKECRHAPTRPSPASRPFPCWDIPSARPCPPASLPPSPPPSKPAASRGAGPRRRPPGRDPPGRPDERAPAERDPSRRRPPTRAGAPLLVVAAGGGVTTCGAGAILRPT